MGVFATKLSRAALASLLFCLVSLGIYLVHVRWLRVDVVFYAALSDVLLAAALTGLLLWRARWFAVLGDFEKLQLFVLWLLAGYALAISVPTVIDRSLSFYLLEKLAQRGGSIREDAFERVFVEEYMREHRLVAVRLTEQLESGTIRIEAGCVHLAPRGRMLASLSRAFRRHLLPRRRLLLGEYSDALTDPFRESVAAPDYSCARR